MKMKYLLVLSLLVFNVCFAERYIQPTKYDYQEEILIKGGAMIASNKTNSVLMYQTSETINNRKGNFYFMLSNQTDKLINFYVSNLRVTDQWGRPIRIVRKKEIIANKKNSKNLAIVASALCTGLESMNAQNAGNVAYQSHTNGNFNSNFNVYGSGGWVNGSVSGHNSSTTSGTVQIEALRQQAQRQVRQNAQQRNNTIEANYDDWEYRLNNFYFDSTTVFPGQAYAANFQIDVHKNIEKDLQYLLFKYDIGGEEHTFCFYCGREKKKWYHLGS